MKVWKPAALALIGLGGIAYGLSFDPTHPKCGPSEMHPGQVCQSDARGTPVHRSYEQVVQQTNSNRLIYPGGGGVLIVSAGVWAYWTNRRKVAPAAAPVLDKPAGRLRGGPTVAPLVEPGSVSPAAPTARPADPSAPPPAAQSAGARPSEAPYSASAPGSIPSADLDVTQPRFGTVNHPGPRPLPTAASQQPPARTCPQQSGQVVTGTQVFRRALDPEATLPPGTPRHGLTAAQAEETLPPNWTPVRPRLQPSQHQQPQRPERTPAPNPDPTSHQRTPAQATSYPPAPAPNTTPYPQAHGAPQAPTNPGQAPSPGPYRPRAPRPDGYSPKR